jgi:hypothetical protein
MEYKSGERRQHRRYPIRLPAVYRAGKFRGIAETIDLSARGVSFEPDSQLPVGTSIEVAVEWPVLFNGRVRMKLVYAGRVTRTMSRTHALVGHRPEFRIAGHVPAGTRAN